MENKDPYLSSQEQAKELFKNVQNNQTRFGVVSTAEIEQLRRDYIDRAQRRIDIPYLYLYNYIYNNIY